MHGSSTATREHAIHDAAETTNEHVRTLKVRQMHCPSGGSRLKIESSSSAVVSQPLSRWHALFSSEPLLMLSLIADLKVSSVYIRLDFPQGKPEAPNPEPKPMNLCRQASPHPQRRSSPVSLAGPGLQKSQEKNGLATRDSRREVWGAGGASV